MYEIYLYATMSVAPIIIKCSSIDSVMVTISEKRRCNQYTFCEVFEHKKIRDSKMTEMMIVKLFSEGPIQGWRW